MAVATITSGNQINADKINEIINALNGVAGVQVRDNNGTFEFYSGGVWVPVAGDKSRFKNVITTLGSGFTTAATANTETTILNVSGKGFFDVMGFINTEYPSCGYSGKTIDIKVYVDGVLKVYRRLVGGAKLIITPRAYLGVTSWQSTYTYYALTHSLFVENLSAGMVDWPAGAVSSVNAGGSAHQVVVLPWDALYYDSSVVVTATAPWDTSAHGTLICQGAKN